ncbi:MAG: hypothetical protein F9K23_15635 [Bacteroidetes bacterium]|nr:MAG: hypothetical protein F9K23_15635 [Bacteroidota bacterium]
MKRRIDSVWLLLLVLVVPAFFSCTTNKIVADNCMPIAEMFAFGDSSDFKLDTTEINKEKLKNFKQEIEKFPPDESGSTFFVVPFFVNKIRFFHSRCGRLNDNEEYTLLVEAYNLIVNQKFSTAYSRKDIVIDSITENFKSLCRVDSVFASAVGIFMAGPYYGAQVEINERVTSKDSLLIDGGTVVLYYDELNKSTGIGFTKTGKVSPEWFINLTENPFTFNKFGSLKKTVLGYEIGLDSNSEGCKVYMKPDGAFRFYLLNMF